MKKYFTNVIEQVIKVAIGIVIAVIIAWLTEGATVSPLTIGIVLVVFLLATGVQVWLDIGAQRKKNEAYFSIIMSEQPEYPAQVEASAASYFKGEQIDAVTVQPMIVQGNFSTISWRNALQRAEHELAMLLSQYTRLHLVCATPWLWAFALGTRLGNAMNPYLYHYGDGKFYQVWQGEPNVQMTLNSPNFTMTSGVLVQKTHGNAADMVALIAAIGPDHSTAIMAYLQRQHPDLPIWCYQRPGHLEPKAGLWLQSAAELAKAIEQVSEGGQRTVCLLGTAPAALAFLAGTAIKRFRRIHLWQFVTSENDYTKLLELPVDGS